VDKLAFFTVYGLVRFLNLLPLGGRLLVLGALSRLVLFFMPRLRKIAMRNLELAFPGQTAAWRREVLRKSCDNMARVLVDFARLHTIDRQWVMEHVDCPYLRRFEELKQTSNGRGILIATGHLGSFELLAHCVAMYGYPISFIVRDFKLPRLDRWWRSVREAHGNRVISRRGAFQHVSAELNAGRVVAILFDQNVTRNHAVFVDWFGRPAATTRAPALAALRAEVPVIVTSITHTGGDRYRINVAECDFTALYSDKNLSAEEKVNAITSRISAEYQNMIRSDPGSWFWIHRRWKTAPEGAREDFYD